MSFKVFKKVVELYYMASKQEFPDYLHSLTKVLRKKEQLDLWKAQQKD